MKTDKIYSVLFLCTGNSARSILGETILNRLGDGRFQAFSAGSQPAGQVNPFALKLLREYGYATQGLRSKSWVEFSGADAPQINFIFTVCDSAANEICPVWPGHPMTVHWGLSDPAAVEGSDLEIRAAFAETYRQLEARIKEFLALPIGDLVEAALRRSLIEIGDDHSL